ncbi:MAG: DUF4399 domain-containing protein [Balneolaceae bacterium]
MRTKNFLPLLAFTLLFPVCTLAQISDAPEDARTYIVSPQHGAVVPTTFTVVFGLSGMGVAPAGQNVEGTGHHHLLINVDELPDLTKPLPTTDQVRHFGLGQTETVVTLPPGKHTLQLILGDFTHTPHNPPVMSEKITIYVSGK